MSRAIFAFLQLVMAWFLPTIFIYAMIANFVLNPTWTMEMSFCIAHFDLKLPLLCEFEGSELPFKSRQKDYKISLVIEI